MSWVKKGLIYNKSHAQLPVAWKMQDRIRIFYSSRFNNKSLIEFIDVDIKEPRNILSGPKKILIGTEGSFDQDGCMTSCITLEKGVFNLYYTGWKLSDKYPYALSIGVAKSVDLENFTKQKEPIIESCKKNNGVCCSPFIIDGDSNRMWFISGEKCEGWIGGTPMYTIFYAEFYNKKWRPINMNWPRKKMEIFARPFVKKYNNFYEMWYSKMIFNVENKKEYSIGYAISNDGLNWTRQDDKKVIEKSQEGWDSQMVAFPYFLDNFMFYSGNNFGEGGLGYAIKI